MYRIIAIAITTLIPAFASASDAPQAPKVDAAQAEIDRAYVHTVGILGMIEQGGATEAVLSSSQIGPELDRALVGMTGRSYASTSLPSLRRVRAPSEPSVSIGAIRAPTSQSFVLAEHRSHRPATP